MRATGSDTVVLDDVEVPERMSLPGRSLLDPGRAAAGDGMAGLPVISVLALTASATALGGAEAAVEIYRERIADRILAYTLGDRAVEQPAAQIRYATALSDLRAARARWDAAIKAVTDAAACDAVDMDVRVDARLAAAATVRASRRIVTHVCDGAGASVYMSDHPLQRIQRDIETLKGHVIFDWDRTAELAGKHALGIPLAEHEMV
jgi:alkylation response protein AidB-like acyl-CoA dehydrogenase